MADIKIQITGADKLRAALAKFPQEAGQAMKAAGAEASEEVLNTVGLRRYPPAGPGNAPPVPFYIRGRGTQYSTYNAHNSERLGTQFYVTPEAKRTIIGNRASYAKYVVGEGQARAMGRIGWRRLIDVANEKRGELTKIYNGWVDKMLRQVGLK